MKISDGVDHDKENQKYSTSGGSTSVVRNLEILRREYRGTDLVHDAQDQVAASIPVRPNVDQENSWRIAEGSSPEISALPLPTTPMTASGRNFFNDIKWIMSISAAASFPAKVNMANCVGTLRQQI